MLKLVLPVWLYGGQVAKLRDLFQLWWALVESWLRAPFEQVDPRYCAPAVLALLADWRNVEPILGEDVALFRLRVEHAHINAVDAGSTAGIKRIFARLGIGHIELIERDAAKPWDVIQISLSDAQLSQNAALLALLIAKYGRTCRRYEFTIINNVDLGLSAGHGSHTYKYHEVF